MQQVVIINGFETVIEIPDNQVLSPVTYTGDKDKYRIEYGNGLVEVGGIVTIPFKNQTEKSVVVDTPFYTLLDAQVTALDIVGDFGESVHVGVDNDRVTVYGHTSQAYTGDFKVKWSAKGVI